MCTFPLRPHPLPSHWLKQEAHQGLQLQPPNDCPTRLTFRQSRNPPTSTGFEAVFWKALVAPAGLPDDVREKLAEAMEAVGEDEELAQTLLDQGLLLSAHLTAEE